MTLKRRLPILLIVVLCVTMIGSVNFPEINADNLDAESIITESCETTTGTLNEDNAVELLFDNDEDIIYTNNEQPIETDDL